MPVKVIAGCRASGRAADRGGRRENGQPVRAGGVRDHLAGAPRAGLGEPGHHGGERVVRDGQQQQVGAGATSSAGRSGTPGSSRATRSTDSAETPEAATTGRPERGQRRAEHGAHPSGADDADGHGRGAQLCAHAVIQSSSRGTGRGQGTAGSVRPAV